MAVIHLPRCTAATPDPIQLHAQAMNSLSRCLLELRAALPSYALAQNLLEEAREALETLAAVDAGSVH